MNDRTDLMPPGEWVPNDFTQDDRIIVEHYGPATVLCHNEMHYENLVLTVKWDRVSERDERVWPNLEWVGYELGDEST